MQKIDFAYSPMVCNPVFLSFPRRVVQSKKRIRFLRTRKTNPQK